MGKKDSVESEKSDKSDKSDKLDKKLFFRRLCAYVIDILLVSLVASIIAAPFINSNSLMRVSEALLEVADKYASMAIDNKAYISEMIPLNFQLARESGIITLASLFISSLYFIVYQFKNDGQTLGKKIMKIKVIATKRRLTMNDMLIRSIIINSILVDMLVFALVIFGNQNIYYYGSIIFERIQSCVVMISVFMIIFSKNGRGLHDLISHSEVVKVK